MIFEIFNYRYNCSIDDMEPGQVIVSPGDLTHSYIIKSVKSGEAIYVDGKMKPRKFICNEIHGDYHCAGMDKEEEFES